MTQAAFKVAVLRCCLMAMIGWPSLSEGQLKGRFYLDKESYTSGEPVFLYFKITNNSTVAYKVVVADPYSFCSQYGVHLSSDSGPGSACEPSAQPGSCVLSQALLGPGDSKTERILLNYDHELSRPENYHVHAKRRVMYGEGGELLHPWSAPAVEFAGRFRFRIDAVKHVRSELLKSLADQLQSKDPLTASEAARILAAIGPGSMESTLLRFPENSLSRPYAPLAFHRLNTKRSTIALAQLLQPSRMGSPESLESAAYLGKTGDPQWFPLLRDLASQQPGGEYAYPAAEAGGSEAIPLLTKLTAGGMSSLSR